MGILDDDVVAVRTASDIVGIITQYTQLRRVGRRWVGLCPFHSERSPSFSVNDNDGLYYCLAGETRVLTWDGVKPIRELAGKTVKVLTEKGQWVDAPFRSFGVQPLMRITLTRNRQRKVIHATPEHRWFIRGKGTHRYERTTAELLPGHPLSWSFPANRTRCLGDLSPFGVAHGITYGDGSLFGKSACVDLHGDKDAQLLKWFPLNRTLSCKSMNGKPVTKVVDLPRYFKQRPSLDESPQYLAGWLAGYLAADGHVSKDGTCMLNSADRSNLEFVREVCTRLGIGTYGITTQLREGLPGRELSELHRVHLITEDMDERFFLIDEHRLRFAAAEKAWVRRGWMVKSVEEADRVEEVFCAVVEGTHNFVLEDNILTGNCFGCQAKGDVITFVREVENLDFVGAVEWLAGRAGITLRYTDRAEGEGRKRRARLVEVMGRAVEWYHERLLSGPDAGVARRYLRERGLDGDVVREYRIGWAPDAWDEVCRGLRLSGDDARDSGLGFVNSRNRLQDTFRARVLFPIFDAQGDPVSFGGRILPGTETRGNQGKYKNTPETPLYHKSKVLYGLDRAKAGIVASDTAVVCEGYTDVIGFHRSGVRTAVATCGTALTDEHVKLLRRYARRLVLAFDADGAGQAAAERFYQWERDHDLEVAVADLPVGQDPADLAAVDPERLAAAVDSATPFLRFRLDRVFGAADLTTVEGRARAAERALDIVAEHPDAIVRDQYLMEVAGHCRTEPALLREQLEVLRRRPRPAPSADRGRSGGAGRSGGSGPGRGNSGGPRGRGSSAGPGPGPGGGDGRRGPSAGSGPGSGGVTEVPNEWDGPPVDPSWGPPPAGAPKKRTTAATRRTDGPALEVLRHAVHSPDDVGPWLDPVLFRHPLHREALLALRSAGAPAVAVATSDGPVGDLVAQLVVGEPTSEPWDAVKRWLTELARDEVTDLRLRAAGIDDSAQALTDLAFLGRCIDELRVANTAVVGADRLLAWLRQRAGDGG